MARVTTVTTTRQLKAFVELPYSLYKQSEHWVQPLRRDEYRRLSPRHNPFLEHAEMTLWIAEADGRVVGRIAAIDDRLYNEKYAEPTTWFGFFEAEDASIGRELLEVVEDWGRGRKSRVVLGPANPSLNESAGLLVQGFDEDPYILMPYNPPSYVDYVEGAGYVKAKDLLAWALDSSRPLSDRITRVADRVRRRHGIVVRTVNMKDFDRELGHLKTIYRAAWSDNWGFVPPTDAEMRQLAVDLRPILDPEVVLFAEMHGQVVGCAVAIPNLNQVLRRMNGNLFPFGLWHFLRRKSIVNEVRAVLLGVLPEFRHIGLYPLLIAELFRRAAAVGYRASELGWTLEDNNAVNAGIEATGGRLSKVYRIYEKRLDPTVIG